MIIACLVSTILNVFIFLQVSVVPGNVTGRYANVTLYLERQSGGYILTTIIPNCFLVVIALSTFSFPRDDLTNRIMVTLTLFVVAASLLAQVAQTLPKTSYIKCIDIIFIATMSMLLLVFISHTLSSFIIRKTSLNRLHKRNQIEARMIGTASLTEKRIFLQSDDSLVKEMPGDNYVLYIIDFISLFFCTIGTVGTACLIITYCTNNSTECAI